MTVYHTVWPEGLPDKAVSTASWWRAHWVKFKWQLEYMIRFRSAHRVRHAVSDKGMPYAHGAEMIFKHDGAICPPGGWPASVNDNVPENMTMDMRVVTHSVV